MSHVNVQEAAKQTPPEGPTPVITRMAATVGGLALAATLGIAAPASASTPHPHRPAVSPAVTTGRGDHLITDAPTTIHLGAEQIAIPVTVGSDRYLNEGLIDLYVNGSAGDEKDVRAEDVAFPDHSVRSFTFRPILSASDIGYYGVYQWWVLAGDIGYNQHELTVNTLVKANSLLGFTAARTGSTVTVTVSARVWNNATQRYNGYPVGVYLQKQAADGSWANVGAVTLGSSGNGTKGLTTGTGVYRLYDHDTATIWGSTTQGVRVD